MLSLISFIERCSWPCQVELDLERYEQRRLHNIAPKNYVPEPWKPLFHERPREYFKVILE